MLITIIKEIFYALTGALILFTMLELVWPRVVLAYFNINWVLIFWILAGIVIVIKEKNNQAKNE